MVWQDRFPDPAFCEYKRRDFHSEVLGWLDRCGHRIFNFRRASGMPTLTHDETEDMLVQKALEVSGHTINEDDLWRLADKAATLVIIENSEESLHDWHVHNGRKGGRISKRRPVLVWNVDEHGDIDNYTNAQVRKIMQETYGACGERVVSTLRKRTKNPVPTPKPKRVKTREQKAADRARREFRWEHSHCGCTTAEEHPVNHAAVLESIRVERETRLLQMQGHAFPGAFEGLLAGVEGPWSWAVHDKPVRKPEPMFAEIIDEPWAVEADYMSRFLTLTRDLGTSYSRSASSMASPPEPCVTDS